MYISPGQLELVAATVFFPSDFGEVSRERLLELQLLPPIVGAMSAKKSGSAAANIACCSSLSMSSFFSRPFIFTPNPLELDFGESRLFFIELMIVFLFPPPVDSGVAVLVCSSVEDGVVLFDFNESFSFPYWTQLV